MKKTKITRECDKNNQTTSQNNLFNYRKATTV